jgi:hypothetical protein
MHGKNDSDEYGLIYNEMKVFVASLDTMLSSIKKKVINNESIKPEEKIKMMHIAESTKRNYLVEFRLYETWMRRNSKTMDADSANLYLSSLKCRTSTLKKKQTIMQTILRLVYDPSVRLNMVKRKVQFKPKYSLSQTEVDDYLEEQRGDIEFYIIQKLLIKFGLRVNTPALLKIKHLLFLFQDDLQILLPDLKNKQVRCEEIDSVFADEITEYINEAGISQNEGEEYLFLRDLDSQTEEYRAQRLCFLVNRRIKESEVLLKNPNFKYSSHMFRKTKANVFFQEGLKELKERTRRLIGHTSGSTAIEHYLDY